MSADPPSIIDLVAGCRLAVREVVGIDLDFTQDTLPLLDYYVAQAKGTKEEIAQLVAPMCGAYFGEVLRRTLGPASWDVPEDAEPSEFRLQFENVFLELNPLGVALEALMRAKVEDWGGHLEVRPADRGLVENAVELFGEVREEDYFRFGVRYEVIEQVAQALLRQSEREGGTPGRPFDATAYARAREGLGPVLH
ncbi:MAG: hypothetical protein H5U40_09450 [Polyangiaceae bacterium]|nr:hypothetical protein [Polyangiaceae bacterium]